MKKFLILLILTMSILGCTTIKEIPNIKESSISISNGEILHEIKSVDLTSNEIFIVDHSMNNLKLFIDKWKDVVNLSNIDEFNADYKKMKTDYFAVYKVIENNFDKYPEELKIKFSGYKKSAKALDNQVSTLVVGKDIYLTVKTGVKLAMVVAGMVK